MERVTHERHKLVMYEMYHHVELFEFHPRWYHYSKLKLTSYWIDPEWRYNWEWIIIK